MVTIGVETWISIVAALAACRAAVASWWSSRISRRALILAEGQEERRRPKLVLYFMEGYVRIVEAPERQRFYAFLLSVSNPSDINNSVAYLDLHLTYLTPRQLRMTVKVPSRASIAERFGDDRTSALSPPFSVNAHQTTAGWTYFRVDKDLLSDTIVDGYRVVATDSHGVQSGVEAVIVREFADEAEAKESGSELP